MARYTEEDVQNALADLESGVPLATAATRHGVPRTTLRRRFNGAQPHRHAHEGAQRLTPVQEEHLVKWILQQEALGYAPTHAQVRAIAIAVLKRQGDHKNLGKKWTNHFVRRNPVIKSKLGRRTSWERVNEATPENIKHLFNLYETVSWIPPRRRYNADEGGIMEGQGINGLVIGSSQENPNAVPVKTINARTWTSILECISALGVALDPLIIFKAKSIQEQWFKQEFLAQNPGWHVTFSQNGWTSNDIAIEWVEKVFLPQTEPDDPSEARLLIVDGHGSHTSDMFMATCYLNNVYLLFLPAHTSHILQPLDLGCFSSLKAAYRRFVGEYTAQTDKTKLGKAKFLEFYAEARKIGLREQCIRSGWKATGLYPKNIKKPLGSRWVVVRERPLTPPPSTVDIRTPKRGSDVIKLFSGKDFSPSTRRCVRITATAFDRASVVVAMQDHEIASLHEQLEQANPPKRRKVATNPNDLFAKLAEVLSQTNQEPSQRIRNVRSAKQEVIIVEEESSSEEAEQPLVRRSARNRRPTRRYLDRDLRVDEESD
jgi:4-hydroxybenzoate polyprenyltransferase